MSDARKDFVRDLILQCRKQFDPPPGTKQNFIKSVSN